MTLPASLIEARIGVSVLVSCTAILMSAAALFWLTAYSSNWEVEAAVVGAGAVAVSAASAWAVGVTVSKILFSLHKLTYFCFMYRLKYPWNVISDFSESTLN